MKLNTADIAILAAAAFVGYMVLRQRSTATFAASPTAPNVRTDIDWSRVPINGLF